MEIIKSIPALDTALAVYIEEYAEHRETLLAISSGSEFQIAFSEYVAYLLIDYQSSDLYDSVIERLKPFSLVRLCFKMSERLMGAVFYYIGDFGAENTFNKLSAFDAITDEEYENVLDIEDELQEDFSFSGLNTEGESQED